MTAQASQLRLLPDVGVPDGYILRKYKPGDEDSWVDLLQFGGFTKWDHARMDEFLSSEERREGSRVVACGEQIVAATFASRRDVPKSIGVLDFVVSHPDHRGNGLGRAVCTAVSKFLAEQGYDEVNLHTDDWRLEAISLYFSLGFQPDMTSDDMPSRWAAIMKNLETMKR